MNVSTPAAESARSAAVRCLDTLRIRLMNLSRLQSLLAVSRGDTPADLFIRNAKVVNTLSYEIEKWNQGGTSFVWVKAPVLAIGNDYIRAYWGNLSVTSPPAYTTNGATWADGFKGVWHMDQTNDTDSTSGRHNGTVYGTIDSTNGVVGPANNFDRATDDHLRVPDSPDFTLSGDYTLSAWVYVHAWSGNQGIMNSRANTGGGFKGWGLGLRDNNAPFVEVENSGGTYTWESGASFADDVWKHVAYTRSGSEGIFYVDGAAVASVGTAQSTGDGGILGIESSWGDHGGYRWDGLFDELRVETVKRSGNWIWACLLNQGVNS